MDAFEQIVSQLLLEDGYWTVVGYKADIKQSQANKLNKSMPRPEIDIVAYRPAEKIIYLIEVKSFIDSQGVGEKPFKNLNTEKTGKYKILTWKKYRDVVSGIVIEDFYSKGLIPDKKVKVEFGLIAGNTYKGTTEKSLKENFTNKGYPNWLVWGPETITRRIRDLAKKGYENNTVTIISKLMNPDLRKEGLKERRKRRRDS